MWSPQPKIIQTRLKPLLHVLSLMPALALVYGAFNNSLGANPVETLTHETGEWGLRFLLITLSISPLVKLSRLKWLMLFRRALGLYSGFYVLLHFLIYLVFDQSLSLTYVLEDIKDRPYISVGFLGFLLLLPLAATSPLYMRRRMGRRWLQLHRLTYGVGVAAIVHLAWLSKADLGLALVYGAIFILLMILRLPFSRKFA